MRTWSFCISDDPSQPVLAAGFVRAETVEDAFALIDDPPCDLYDILGDVEGLNWPNDGPSVVVEPIAVAGIVMH